MAGIDELLGPFPVPLEAGALEHHLLVPVHAEPAQPVQNDLGVLLGRPLPIGIFDAEQKFPARLPGEQPVEKSRASAANM